MVARDIGELKGIKLPLVAGGVQQALHLKYSARGGGCGTRLGGTRSGGTRRGWFKEASSTRALHLRYKEVRRGGVREEGGGNMKKVRSACLAYRQSPKPVS